MVTTTVTDYSVETLSAFVKEHKRAEDIKKCESLTLKDAIVTIMLVQMAYRFAYQVQTYGKQLKRTEYKTLSRRLNDNIRDWKQTMSSILDDKHIAEVDAMCQELEEEQANNLLHLMIACKTEIDKRVEDSYSEIRAYAYRVVVLVQELSFWLKKKVPSRFGGISPFMHELKDVMKGYCGVEVVDTSKFHNIELCRIIFDKALEAVEIEYKQQNS